MNRTLPPAVRRLVLASALLAATLVALLPEVPSVFAALPAPPVILAQDTGKSAASAAREAADAAREIAREANEAAREAAREARRSADEERSDRRRGITIGVGGVDREYDSFDQFLDRDPALAAMVLGIVFIVFLTPILIIGLIIWYKVRKNRMQNETMLRLAEKGIVPPATAMDAIGNNRVDAALASTTGSLPLAEQARIINKRAAWSDLRKGVLMGTVGLALTFYTMIEEGGANWFGLVLLFVGIGYIVLWYFEERQAMSVVSPAQAPARNPGDIQN